MDKRYMALATSMLVLKLLDRQSMYGYQIIQTGTAEPERIQAAGGHPLSCPSYAGAAGRVSTSQQLADNGRIANTMPSHPTDRSCWMKKKKEWRSMNPPSTSDGRCSFGYERFLDEITDQISYRPAPPSARSLSPI